MNEKILELRMYLGLSLRAFAGPIGYNSITYHANGEKRCEFG